MATTIRVRQNGPYLVEGDDVTVVDWNGGQYTLAKRPFAVVLAAVDDEVGLGDLACLAPTVERRATLGREEVA